MSFWPAAISMVDGSELGVRTEDEIDAGAGPLDFAGLAIVPFEHVASSETGFHSVPMSSRFTKKSLVNVSGRSVKTPCLVPPELAFRARMPPTRTVISGAVSVSNCARSTSSSSAGFRCLGSEVVAEPVRYQGSHHSHWPFF